MLGIPCVVLYIFKECCSCNQWLWKILRPKYVTRGSLWKVTKTTLDHEIRENVFRIYLARKKRYHFLSFSFLWLSQLNIRRFFPNKDWRKRRFQGQTAFMRVYFSGLSPSVAAALCWCESSLDSWEVPVRGESTGTSSWLAAFSGFVEELDGSLWRLLSSPEVDECLFLPNSSLIGGCKLWKTTQRWFYYFSSL